MVSGHNYDLKCHPALQSANATILSRLPIIRRNDELSCQVLSVEA